MNYRDYQNTRDRAWRVLLGCGIDQLPVDINKICRMLQIKVCTYRDAREFLEKTQLTRLSQQTDGFTFFSGNEPVILFDGENDPFRVRSTIAHELGHLLLGHVRPGKEVLACHTPGAPRDRYEKAADQFAARLLAPACVLWGLDLHKPKEIVRLCHISEESAQARARRMAVLYRRKRFLTSPVERQVFWKFQTFMSEYQS